MQEPPVTPFDDPSLKAALRRSLGKESAPASLRERVRAMAAETRSEPKLAAGGGSSDQPIPLFRRSPLYRFAVAAVLVLGFGGLGYQIWQMNRTPTYDVATAVPESLYAAMIETHTARATGKVGGDTVTTVDGAAGLAVQVKRPVLAADLAKDGWAFQGGAVRTVGSHSAAQLFFTKGKAAISVFSLPAAAAPGAKEGMTYETTRGTSPIAGFLTRGGLFCIVGSSEDASLNVDDVRKLLEAHRGDLKG